MGLPNKVGASLNMLPRTPSGYVAYQGTADAKLQSNRSPSTSTSNQSADFAHLVLRQFGGPMVCAATHSTLTGGVERIVFMAPQKQVRRAKARRIIASVTYLKVIWNRYPCRDFKGQHMSTSISTVEVDRAISRIEPAARPLHTRVAFWNVLQHLTEQFIASAAACKYTIPRAVALTNTVILTAAIFTSSCILGWHCEALQRLRCLALAALTRGGAIPILPQGAH